MSEMRELLAENMRRLMQSTGLDTQAALARASGVSQTQVGFILRREKAPTVETLDKLARALRVPAFVLIAPFDSTVASLIADFHACDEAGRELIARVASAQARVAGTSS